MKALADRHADRAERKAANRADLNPNTLPNIYDVGGAVSVAQQLANTVAAFTKEAQEEFQSIMADYEPASVRSIAEDENGETMAGIGVINTKVVPATVEAGSGGGSGGGWVDTPPTPELTGAENLAGQALVDQGVSSAETQPEAPKSSTRRTNRAEGE